MGRDRSRGSLPAQTPEGSLRSLLGTGSRRSGGRRAFPAPAPRALRFGDERDAARAAAGRRTDPHRSELPPDGRVRGRARRGGRDGARPEPADGDFRRRRGAGARGDRARQEEPLFVGGPVSTGSVLAVAELDDPDDASELLFGAVGFVQELDVPVVRGRIFLGYRRLERRPARANEEESWLVLPAGPTTSSATTPRGSGAPCSAARAVVRTAVADAAGPVAELIVLTRL